MHSNGERNLLRIAMLTTMLILVGDCVLAQDVHYNFMPGTDFAKYHTYKWVDIPSNVHPNQIVAQEIRDAVNNSLATAVTEDHVPAQRQSSGTA